MPWSFADLKNKTLEEALKVAKQRNYINKNEKIEYNEEHFTKFKERLPAGFPEQK
jgi:hypothetical protein